MGKRGFFSIIGGFSERLGVHPKESHFCPMTSQPISAKARAGSLAISAVSLGPLLLLHVPDHCRVASDCKIVAREFGSAIVHLSHFQPPNSSFQQQQNLFCFHKILFLVVRPRWQVRLLACNPVLLFPLRLFLCRVTTYNQ